VWRERRSAHGQLPWWLAPPISATPREDAGRRGDAGELNAHTSLPAERGCWLADKHVSRRIPPRLTAALGSWTYILSCLYPLHHQPELAAVYMLLPVAMGHDSGCQRPDLVAFVKNSRAPSHDPDSPNCIPAGLRWQSACS
jgi:hypothetical protein